MISVDAHRKRDTKLRWLGHLRRETERGLLRMVEEAQNVTVVLIEEEDRGGNAEDREGRGVKWKESSWRTKESMEENTVAGYGSVWLDRERPSTGRSKWKGIIANLTPRKEEDEL